MIREGMHVSLLGAWLAGGRKVSGVLAYYCPPWTEAGNCKPSSPSKSSLINYHHA